MKQVRRDSSQVCSVQGTPRSDTTRTVNTRSEVVKGDRTDHVSITLWCQRELKGDCMVRVGLVESRKAPAGI